MGQELSKDPMLPSMGQELSKDPMIPSIGHALCTLTSKNSMPIDYLDISLST